MRYTYAYKTNDGQRHEATMEAASRDDVFAALRVHGIRAIKVVAADGSKANGEIRGIRKRMAALGAGCLVLAAVIAGIVSFFAGKHSTAQTLEHSSTSHPRHQIYGDPVIVEEIEYGRTEAWLTNRVDRFLAWFAQPGKLMCPKGADMRQAAGEFVQDLSGLPKGEISSRLPITETDPREIRELKQIVNGMREELEAYLANGNGTPRSYCRRLLQRIRQESQIYERIRRELEHETDATVFEQKNQALRNLGLRTIPNPKDGE